MKLSISQLKQLIKEEAEQLQTPGTDVDYASSAPQSKEDPRVSARQEYVDKVRREYKAKYEKMVNAYSAGVEAAKKRYAALAPSNPKKASLRLRADIDALDAQRDGLDEFAGDVEDLENTKLNPGYDSDKDLFGADRLESYDKILRSANEGLEYLKKLYNKMTKSNIRRTPVRFDGMNENLTKQRLKALIREETARMRKKKTVKEEYENMTPPAQTQSVLGDEDLDTLDHELGTGEYEAHTCPDPDDAFMDWLLNSPEGDRARAAYEAEKAARGAEPPGRMPRMPSPQQLARESLTKSKLISLIKEERLNQLEESIELLEFKLQDEEDQIL